MITLKVESLSIKNDTRMLNLIKHTVRTDADLLRALELYKMVDLEEIISVFNMYNPGRQIEWIDEIQESTMHKDLCLEYGVLIGNLRKGSLEIIIDVTDERDISSLEMGLSDFHIVRRFVTPGNFIALSAKVDKGYNYRVLFRRLVIDCIDNMGTDLHFCTRHVDKIPGVAVQYRIGNRIVDSDLFDLDGIEVSRMLKEVLSKNTTTLPLDLDSSEGATTYISDVFEDGQTDLRFTANASLGGYHAVIRIQNKSTVSFKIDQLGFSEEHVQILKKLAKINTGLTMITGLPRTGKNTTALAMTNQFLDNDSGIKIVDYSSPPEVLMPYTQIDYRDNIDILQNCISLAKKQDVDLALINEIPNSKVAFAVQGLVNSGIGVITTTHIDRLWHIPYKFYELFGEYYKNVFGQLNAVINQKMFIRQCHICGVQHNILDHVNGEQYAKFGLSTYKVPKGCSKCVQFSGKIQPYVEILIFTPEIKRMIQNAGTLFDIDVSIEDYLVSNSANMEKFIVRDIRLGRLPVESLDVFLTEV